MTVPFEVVVEGIAPAEALDSDPRDAVEPLGVLLLRGAEQAADVLGQELAELIRSHFGHRHHRRRASPHTIPIQPRLYHLPGTATKPHRGRHAAKEGRVPSGGPPLRPA